MIKLLVVLCVFAATVSSLVGCHASYTEEEAWRECCFLVLSPDEKSSSESRDAIIRLGDAVIFNRYGQGVSRGNKQHREKVQRAVEVFLEGDLRARPKDYFSRLGMTCAPAQDSAGDFVECVAELPVSIRCDKWRFAPFSIPLPKEAQGLKSATLHVSVDLSDTAVLGVASNVSPLPGGRLCHR
jgi:hypothetical protein